MAGVDRLSALPLELKTFILDHLPIEDAVCTSTLSQSWRHIWTHLPGFSFDMYIPGVPNRFASISSQVQVVQHLISSLRGPIVHFDLYYFARSYEALDLFGILQLIFQKGDLQSLWIKNEGCQSIIELPYFRFLRVLYLCKFHIRLPRDFQGFEHLEDLSLFSVDISQKDIDLLIKGSKKLRLFKGSLNSAHKDCLSVTFFSPLLTGIQFYFTKSIKEARVIDAPCLEGADIASQFTNPKSQDFVYVVARTMTFMVDIATVSDLSLDFNTLKHLSEVDASHTLRLQFQRLRSLRLTGEPSCLDKSVYTIFCCLLITMPILENLEIKSCDPLIEEKGLDESDAIPLYECIKKEYGISCLDETLRRVTISVVKSIHPVLMSMIRFILLNANVLEIIEIIHGDNNEVKPSIREALFSFHKASSNANVVFSSISDWW